MFLNRIQRALQGGLLAIAIFLLPDGLLDARAQVSAEPPPNLPTVETRQIRIGVLAFRPESVLLAQWEPAATTLSSALPGVQVEVRVMSHDAINTAVAAGALDFVFTNPAHYVQLERRHQVSRIATLLREEKGNAVAHLGGVIFTRAQHPTISQLSDLKGKRIAAPVQDTATIGGFLAQARELLALGIQLPQDAELLITGMPHERVVVAIQRGEADAGFVRTGLLEDLAQRGVIQLEDFRILGAKTEPQFPYQTSTHLYPEWPLAALAGTDRAIAARVVATLLSIPYGSATAFAGEHYGWTIPLDYEPVHELLRSMRAPPYDEALRFELRDVLQRYLLESVTLGLLLILLLSWLLWRTHRARLALATERNRLNVTLQSIGDAVITTDAAGRVNFLNPVAEQLTGWSNTEAQGRAMREIFRILSPDSGVMLECPIDPVLRDGRIVELSNHTLLLARDGRQLPIADSAAPIRASAGGNILGAVLVFRDQTEEYARSAAINESRQRMQAFIDHTPALIYLTDPAGRYTLANQHFLELLQRPPEAVLGRTRAEIGPNALPSPSFPEPDEQILNTRQPLHFEETLGERTYLSVRFPVLDEQGVVRGVGCVSTDISDRKAGEKRLRLAGSVFDHALEGILITDAENRVLDVNPAFERITGYPRETIVGLAPRMLKSDIHDRQFYREMWDSIQETGHWSGEIWNRRRNGEIYPELLTVCAVRDEVGEISHYIGIFSDITSIKDQQRRLEHLAHYDALTQLPNRILLSDRLRMALAQARRTDTCLAVCYLDLDGFKPINDSYGHETGDRLLILMAQRLRDSLREGDTVARLGGDEFVLLFGNLNNQQELVPLLHRVLETVAEPAMLDARALEVSASIGVTLFPADEVTPDVLLRHADQAMYVAKQGGRNRYSLFDLAGAERIRAQFDAIDQVREGLQAGEFCLFYQPKVDMRNSIVIGAEALIRWRHPQRGLLSPGEFLPLLEESDFLVELGDWVLQTALRQMETWWQNAQALKLSINVSGRHLLHERFAQRLQELLELHPAVPAAALELEILETAALDDLARVTRVMETCRQLGVRFAIDDFGTGYSSLTYFRRLPADVLKIDQTFVRDMLIDSDDLAIVEGVISLTEAFRRQVIAEGVESVAHGVMLLQLGCDLAQGYVIARPMPAEDLPNWVRNYRPEPAWVEAARIPWSRDDHSLLNAALDHRRWVEDMKRYVHGDAKPPPLDELQCRFSRWFVGSASERYQHLPQFSQIDAIHHQVHRIGRDLHTLVLAGKRPEAIARLDTLLRARDELIGLLNQLLAGVSVPGPEKASAD